MLLWISKMLLWISTQSAFHFSLVLLPFDNKSRMHYITYRQGNKIKKIDSI